MLTDWAQEESRLEEDSVDDQLEAAIQDGRNDANVPVSKPPTFPPTDPIFRIDALERNAARGHGEVTSAAAANNVILVGTSKGWLIRHDFGGEEALELDLNTTRQNDQTVSKVFLDNAGRHALVSLKSTTGFPAETLYMHARWKKARPLSRLKGLLVTAVAWNKQQSSDTSTREFLVATSNGQIHEALIEEKDKREKHVKLLYELQESQEPICAVQMEAMTTSSGPRYFVMAVTATRLYTFAGTGSLEATFAAAKERTVRFTELPGSMPYSELHFFGQKRTERFAWMAGPGIYHGQINLGAQHSNTEENYVDNKWLLEYSKLSGGNGAYAISPVSMAVTEFHYLLLFRDVLKAVNRVSQEVVEEETLGARDEIGPRGMLGLCHDHAEDVIYCYSDSTIYEVTATDEGKDMWRLHLERGEYASALSYARDSRQKDRIYAAQAEVAFEAGDYARAATFYAKVQNMTTFEEVALKFVNVGEQDALRTFLLHKLDHLDKDERSQITMVATWCTELYLDKINRLLLDGQDASRRASNGEAGPDEYQHTVQEFRAFLSDCKGVLDEATTVKLLGSYGREEELVLFATLKDHHGVAIQHHIQKGDARRAIMVLRKPSVSPEVWYNFAPALIALDPALTVEAWMAAGANLNPRRLIAALMRYTSGTHAEGDNFAIQYLEFCVRRMHNEDPAIHNLLLSLYAKQAEEAPLLQFLASPFGGGRAAAPDVFYDPKFALRLCLEERKLRACVFVYGQMEMHEEAVALALQVDLELAKAEADKVEDDEPLRKKLWLRIAKHVIEQERAENGAEGENIRKAIAFLKETDGLLKIEDILPFFPDFALIDDFKEAICASLEEYNRQIEDLKAEMNEATRGADNIRRDIAALSQRYAVVNRDEPCGVCGKPILGGSVPAGSVPGGTIPFRSARGSVPGGSVPSRVAAAAASPFYVFPCEHAFHADCLTQHVMENARSGHRDHIVSLRRQLASLAAQSVAARTEPTSPDKNANADVSNVSEQQPSIEKVRTALDDAVAGECPFCGELMVQAISEPFVGEDEYGLAQTWEIRRENHVVTAGFVT